MRKHLRMIAGIILHPVRLLMAWTRKSSFEYTIRRKVLLNWELKNHERLHHYVGKDFPGCCTYIHSELINDMYRGALDRR